MYGKRKIEYKFISDTTTTINLHYFLVQMAAE